MELLPERALYWPERGLLAVADLHWGKPESFQQHGIPLPAGVLEDDLERLSRALRRTGVEAISRKRGPAIRVTAVRLTR